MPSLAWDATVAPPAPTAFDEEINGAPNDRKFIWMLAAYRATGGLARGDDLARLFEDHRCGDFASLARLIVSREVFCIDWRHVLWVPMFQFELHGLSIKRGPQQVRAELAPELDDWAVAAWFARPNSWLNDLRPVDLLDSKLPDVLEAARADRCVVLA